MNETLIDANAASFRTVLHNAFADHTSARLGWFRKPLSEALIEPLLNMAQELGVRIHKNTRVRNIQAGSKGIELQSAQGSQGFNACILALPLRSGQQLLGLPKTAVTRRITNIHMWLRDMPALSHPFIGGIGTAGQWFFDVSNQMRNGGDNNIPMRHICAVISADDGMLHSDDLVQLVCSELSQLSGNHRRLIPEHTRIISEHHATTSVTDNVPGNRLRPELPDGLIDACEAPFPGELPSTIEYAVKRGNQAAERCCLP